MSAADKAMLKENVMGVERLSQQMKRLQEGIRSSKTEDLRARLEELEKHINNNGSNDTND